MLITAAIKKDLFLSKAMNFCVPILGLLLFLLQISCSNNTPKIDGYSLVNRHNVSVEEFDPLASLSVGNGNFAFTTDITGLQTFYKDYERGVSLGTMSNWGWHTIPNSEKYDISETYLFYDVKGREIPYSHGLRESDREIGATNYFRENPHRLHLGIIRLMITKTNGDEILIEDVINPHHQLNLWTGEIESNFEVEGNAVKVKVLAHQEKDLIAARIESPLIKTGQLKVEWIFPYGTPVAVHPGYDFNSPEKHSSTLKEEKENSATIHRVLDNDQYYTNIHWSEGFVLEEKEKHHFVLASKAIKLNTLEFSCQFTSEPNNDNLPDFNATAQNNTNHWKQFWESGGAIDFSECTDPRAKELERRTILSQYLTKINGSGNLPPQETGLTFNSWYGKFHLEMIWWHSAHYANWQRPKYLENQMGYYRKILPEAKKIAELQGYKGVRWPKMVGPNGKDSPSGVGVYLIWQQPHLIYFAEQLYRSNPTPEILNEYADLVFATAEFMADFPLFDEESSVYNLAPPLIPAQEHWNRNTTMNPPFELAYWFWGLTVAQKWKERMGQPKSTKWEEVRNNLPAPVSIGGLYMGIGNAPDSYSNPDNMRDHPMVLGTLGMLPEWDKIDHAIMRNTLNLIMKEWNWPQTWGWDYPMVAMCATRLNEPEIALEALLKDVQKNTYLVNGHNYQNERLSIYLPGNGGFLKAIALMCAGWEGCTEKNPGFPKDGNWNVKWENLSPDF